MAFVRALRHDKMAGRHKAPAAAKATQTLRMVCMAFCLIMLRMSVSLEFLKETDFSTPNNSQRQAEQSDYNDLNYSDF
jgi:hypothetical protein